MFSISLKKYKVRLWLILFFSLVRDFIDFSVISMDVFVRRNTVFFFFNLRKNAVVNVRCDRWGVPPRIYFKRTPDKHAW